MRRYRTVIILLLIFAVPLGGAVLAVRYLLPGAPATPVQAKPVPAPPPPPKKEARKILAAARDLSVGTLLREEDMTGVEVAKEDVRRAHLVIESAKTVDSLRGHAVREPILAGRPLTRSALVAPGQRGFLAAALAPGTRAATIRLGAGTSHAGLIDPGDRVDVILTARMRLADNTESVFTRTILEDVRVVAVDRQVDAGAGSGEEEVARAKIVTATLEVSPPQAGLLSLGEHEGTLALVVRSIAAAPVRRTSGDTVELRALLDLPEPEAPPPPPPEQDAAAPKTPEAAPRPSPRIVRIVRGGKVSEEVFGDGSGELPNGVVPAPAPGTSIPLPGRN